MEMVSVMYPRRSEAVNVPLEHGWCSRTRRWSKGRVQSSSLMSSAAITTPHRFFAQVRCLTTLPTLIQHSCGSRSSGSRSQQTSRILGGVASLPLQLFKEPRDRKLREREREREISILFVVFFSLHMSTIYWGKGRGGALVLPRWDKRRGRMVWPASPPWARHPPPFPHTHTHLGQVEPLLAHGAVGHPPLMGSPSRGAHLGWEAFIN
jgi:hypothetical protein